MRLKYLVDRIKDTGSWKELEEFLGGEDSSLRVTNLYGSSKTLILSGIVDACERPVTVITPDNGVAEKMVIDLHQFFPPRIIDYFPPTAGSTIDREWPMKETMGRRMEALRGLAAANARLTIIPCQCLLEEVMDSSELLGMVWNIRHGDIPGRDRLIERLVSLGYRREYAVEEVGVFAVWGGVLDVYGFGMDAPVRLEFVDDELLSMRKFDIQSQRSSEEIPFLHILPMRERGKKNKLSPVFTYIPRDSLVVFIDGAVVRANMERNAFPEATASSPAPAGLDCCFDRLGGMKHLLLEGLHLHSRGADPFLPSSSERMGVGGEKPPIGKSLRFGTREPDPIERNMVRLREIVQEEKESGNQMIILCDNYGQKERFGELLGDTASDCLLEVGGLETGFRIPEARLTLYNDHEIFRRPRRLKYKRRYRVGGGLDSLLSIKPGDYLVHGDYGIGRFEGLKVVRIQEGEIECLSIRYKGGDRVYVPVEKLDLVDKYSGSDSAPPRIDRLGGKGWERVKRSTREGVREMAERLIKLYARRRIASGFSFSDDTPWQLEMESAFAYEDTPDQRRTVDDVKRDMARGKPMDRLICGDVGFGKTEIAVRAAFKAVQDAKQVAVLVPTTILAQQHFMTFSERLADFPVVVEVLSRFKTSAQQKKVLDGLSKGRIDIVIGTHRLLSEDVKFRDLGLLIIDEEHRFGVAHKEKLKDLKEGVDVLQLTATPLPRTLHLSLMGIRDISLINTPPQDRLPIVTYVAEFDKELIREAVMKEVDRGGQVFFVHNRVQTIRSVASMLERWLPDVRFAIAHGQMRESDLEDVMLDFMEGGLDVLVSTMIVGSGLDVPNANTLIVNRADRLGLAQLYQLRGRAGRSYRRAYAYLLTPPIGVLSEEARKRLTVLEEYTELGSGYKIAMRDMEIRGVGNILGKEQHGYIAAAGLEMYSRLLEEEVRRIRGEEIDRREVDLVVELTSLLPEGYVSDPAQRITLYRRLSRVKDPSEVEEIGEELIDRFGALPIEARNLLNVVSIKSLAGKLGIKSMSLKTGELKFTFEEGKPESVVEWDNTFENKRLHVSIEQRSGISMTVTPRGDTEWLDEVKKALREMA